MENYTALGVFRGFGLVGFYGARSKKARHNIKNKSAITIKVTLNLKKGHKVIKNSIDKIQNDDKF